MFCGRWALTSRLDDLASQQHRRFRPERRVQASLMGRRSIDDDELIRQAKARLMNHCGWSEEHAYACLRQAAMDLRVPIAVVAERVLEAGKNPDEGLRRPRSRNRKRLPTR
jgi:AmiR/NasT family two-component response regulator